VGHLVEIGLIMLGGAAVGSAVRVGMARPEVDVAKPPETVEGPAPNGHRVIDIQDPPDRPTSFTTVHEDGCATVVVTGTLDARAALELAEYLSALLSAGSDRLILDTREAGPVPRIVEALSGVAFALEQRSARLGLVGRRGEMLSALINLRANGLAGAIYVFDSVEEATRGVGRSTS
jgi:hypothetical protein